MQTNLISPPRHKTQVAPPNRLALIIGQHEGEMDEPGNFIHEACGIIKKGGTSRRAHNDIAGQGLCLLLAACSCAKRIGRWSLPGNDPMPDLVELQGLAATRLGSVRKRGHVVTEFRDAVAELIRVLGEPGS